MAGLKIIQLTAENVKRIKAVQITPEGAVVEITGRNEQGKSSILDAIYMTLAGGDALKATGTVKPIRQGETSALSRLDLGDLIVTRTWTEKGTYLKVETPDGAEYKSPQALLDKLIGKFSFDPLAFTLMKDAERREAVLGFVKLSINLDEWAAERKGVFEERTGYNRRVKELVALIAAHEPIPEGTPDEETPAETILQAQTKAQEIREANAKERRILESLEDNLADTKKEILNRTTKIAELKAELKELEALQKTEILAADKQERALKAERIRVDALVDPELHEFTEQLSRLEAVNADVRVKKAKANLEASLATEQKRVAACTSRLEALDKTKAEALAAAEFPIADLGIDDDGISYKGIPFSQCSAAERLRVSLAMAMALNPKIRVLRITDGSLLDKANLAVIREMVEANDFQLWIERVDDSGKVGIVIEDGMVAGAQAEPGPADA